MEVLLELLFAGAAATAVFALVVLVAYYVEYKRSTGGKGLTFLFLVSFGVFMGVLPLVILLLFLFLVYSKFVSFLLWLRHGSIFAGLLEGTDAIHTIEGKSKNVGNILFVVRFTGDDFHDTIRSAILKKFQESPIKTPKIWFALRDFMGYSYYVKNQITADDCLGVLDRVDGELTTKDEIVKLVSKYSNRNLPKGHTAMWEALIGTQPVKWKRKHPDDSAEHYPVVLRIHHCLSDAASFVKVFIRIFGDAKMIDVNASTKSAKVNEKITIKLPTIKTVNVKPLGYVWNTIKLTVQSLYVLVMVPPILMVQNMVKARDRNPLHGARMTGEKVFAHGSEEYGHYVNGIKHIKSIIPKTAYPDILFAAISSSFKEYFQKHFHEVPESIAGLVPLFPPPSQLPHFIPINSEKIVCRNVFSLAVLKLPLLLRKSDNDTVDRLAEVKRQIDIFKRALDYKVNYLVLTLFIGILPYFIRKPVSKMLHCTFIISIVPAPSAMSILGGYQVDDVMFWIPNIGAMGVGFSVLSYDKRLQIGLIADKSLIPSQENAQEIIDGIFKYLDLLNLETDFSRV